MSKRWTKHRLDQLHAVQELINECAMIDNATGVIDRLKRIQEAAQKLRKFSLTERKSNFITFLIQIAAEDQQ